MGRAYALAQILADASGGVSHQSGQCRAWADKGALRKVANNYDELARRAERIRTVQDAAE